MKLTFFILMLVASSASGSTNSFSAVHSDLELSITYIIHIPSRVYQPGVVEDPELLRRTRYRFTFRAMLRNVGTKDIVVPTHLGGEGPFANGGLGKLEVPYDFRLKREGDITVVKSPVLFHFLTLRPGEAVFLSPYYAPAEDPTKLELHRFVFRVRDDFADRFECWRGVLEVTIDVNKNRPNKAPEPTTTAVTPRAP